MSTENNKLSENGLSIWDQTIGCDRCNVGWWAENYTDDPTLFHEPDCPLFGNRGEAEQAFNIPHFEKELGRTVGFKNEADMKRLIRLYIDKSIKERGDHYQALRDIAKELRVDLTGIFGLADVRAAISKQIANLANPGAMG